jgi:hypothetical protein
MNSLIFVASLRSGACSRTGWTVFFMYPQAVVMPLRRNDVPVISCEGLDQFLIRGPLAIGVEDLDLMSIAVGDSRREEPSRTGRAVGRPRLGLAD